jgi:hypothetical protein
MADIRQLMILDPGPAEVGAQRGVLRALTDLRMTLRRLVVKSSQNTLARKAYVAVYKAHLWVVKTLGRRYAGTRAVYLTSGMTSGDFNIGVSDIDIAMYGDWPDQRQFRLMKIFGVLTLPLPLLDRRSLASISSVEDLKELCRTDMFMALNHAVGARQWKLLYGEHILSELPEIAPERFAACVYMDLRRWWSTLARTAFGGDVTARDPIFRNTICFKSAAGMLKAEQMLDGSFLNTPRKELLQQEIHQNSDRSLQPLIDSAEQRFLNLRPDLRTTTVPWFFSHAERFHERLLDKPYFASLRPVRREGTAGERIIATETMALAQHLAKIARSHWNNFRAAYLIPAVVLPSIDSLALLLEVDGDAPSWETLAQLYRECMPTPTLPQRLVVFLLLRQAAYQLNVANTLDFFHYTLTPRTAPDVFLALAEPAFLLHGEPRQQPDTPRWTPMAQELFQEELAARRDAYARFGVTSRPEAIENIRNLWRFLQLIAIERSLESAEAHLPTTLAAVTRVIVTRFPDMDADLRELEQLCVAHLHHENVAGEALLSRMYNRILNH